MKEPFIKKKFSAESQAVVEVACEIVDQYEAQGYKLSLRQLYYQLVSRNVVPNTERSYGRISSIMTDARMAGLCDWEMIEDRNRETVTPTHWNSPGEIVRACAAQYRVDRWATQPNYCEVMVEKQALEGVLEPVCNRLDVPFTANKGYSSVTMMYHAGRRLMRKFQSRASALGLLKKEDCDRGEWIRWLRKAAADGLLDDTGNPFKLTAKGAKAGLPLIVVFYLGDHDPSGIDMTRDVAERLSTFSDYTPLAVKRLALNMDQIDKLKPPENPAKMTDSRAADYMAKFGESSWELDAVAPDAMAEIVRGAVDRVIDKAAWEAAGKRQQDERGKLEQVAKRM